ncbi:MAG: TonB-dependent receptor, partial [Amphiplicatus sp.]
DPENGGAVYSVQRIIAGNEALDPEKATTISVGAVYTPSWFSGFSASVDYFNIDIDGAVFTPDGQVVIDQCFAGNATLCSAITRDGANMVTQLRVVPQNVNSEKLAGFDIETAYRTELSAIQSEWSGALSARILATHLLKRTVDSFGSTIDYVDFSGDGEGVPSWRGFATLTYDTDALTASLIGRYVNGGYINPLWTSEDININKVDSRIYFDLSAAYRFQFEGVQMEFFGVVENLLDKDPSVVPPARGNAFTSIGTSASLFDTIGRRFRAGLRFNL